MAKYEFKFLSSAFFLISIVLSIAYGHVRFDRHKSHMEHFLEEIRHAHEENVHHHHKPISKIIGCSSCPSSSICVPRIQCPAHIRRTKEKNIMCHLPGNRVGICCFSGYSHTELKSAHLRTGRNIDKSDLQTANKKSKLDLEQLAKKENMLVNEKKFRTYVTRDMPAYGHFQSSRTPEHAKLCPLALGALQNLFATQNLLRTDAITLDEVELGLNKLPTSDGSFCPPQPLCVESDNRYRSIDGSCNNLLHPRWGSARSPYSRVLPPDYSDGTWAPRLSVNGESLPNARLVSSSLITDRNRQSRYLNLFTMQMGQFITHDITNSVSFTFTNGSGISCCAENGSPLPPEFLHFGCDPIMIEDDDFFSRYGQKCMNFVRTQLAPSDDCSFGYANQMNGVSHYLDLTTLYGMSEEGCAKLREHVGGRLEMFRDFGRDLPKLSTDPDDCISSIGVCFKSGDGHVNQMISLVALHTLWSRQHNRLASELARLNPHWNDEVLFQEARRINIALYQHIIYNEWLPLIIGDDAMDAFALRPTPDETYSLDYDSNVNPSLTNEFSAAAFRFGHSTVDGLLRVDKEDEPYEAISIPEVMFQPSRMRLREFYDRMLRCLTYQPMQQADTSMSIALTRYLFHGGEPFGLDLAAINIQRGRDHGLRSYHHYRTLIGLPEHLSFKEFGAAGQYLRSVYDSPQDIDLWIGGLLENPVDGASVGPTFVEIIADQFSRLKRGDRFYYEHNGAERFSPGQLLEIKKFSMARLVCDNSDNVELLEQPLNAFIRPDYPGNDWIPCSSRQIPRINLTPWRKL